MEFPGGSDGKESAYNVGDLGSIPGLEDSLEEGMAIHSSILAWRTPWTEEPGRLQSMGSHRVEHNWARKHSTGSHWNKDSNGKEKEKKLAHNHGVLCEEYLEYTKLNLKN